MTTKNILVRDVDVETYGWLEWKAQKDERPVAHLVRLELKKLARKYEREYERELDRQQEQQKGA